MTAKRTVASSKDWEAACPYLPRVTIDWLTENPGLAYRQTTGSLITVALNGLSALSAQLEGRGLSAAEELNRVVSRTLDRVLRAVYDQQGSLLKFGGEKIVCYFHGDEHEVRACHAALNMQRELDDLSPVSLMGSHVPLRARMGIASGTLDLFLVGGLHRELVVAGGAARRAVAARAAAPAGEIVVSPETVRHVRHDVLGDSVGPGALLLHAPPDALAAATTTDPLPAPGADLLRAIPDALRPAILHRGGPPSYGETSIGFVLVEAEDASFPSEGEESARHPLASLMGHLQLAASENGLAFLGSEPAPKGLMVTFAQQPSVSDEGHIDRLIMCTRQALDLETPFKLRAGINGGPMFAGHVGPDYRRTYAVLGYAVDRAARLVQAASSGQLLVTRQAVAGLSSEISVTPIGPLSLHGESEPVPAVEIR